jgi:aryl-alcohol dehydrogenase-like predicted oxidoreductase
MQQRQMGKDGPQISCIGLGAWPIGGGMGPVEEAEAIATVRSAIDAGITFLDTAQAYRTSEDTLGKALSDGYRERSFLATKVSGRYSRRDIEEAMDNSLRALGVEHVDLYQIHNWNPQYPIAESMEAMLRLQEAGKTRYIGVSNYNAAQMQKALQTGLFHSNQPRYNLFARDIEAQDLPFSGQNGIGILAHSPLAKGLLTDKYRPGHIFPDADERSGFPQFQGEIFNRHIAIANRLGVLAADKGLSLLQLAIAWILRREEVSCVLVGAKSETQVLQYLGAVGAEFSGGELAEIDKILLGEAND